MPRVEAALLDQSFTLVLQVSIALMMLATGLSTSFPKMLKSLHRDGGRAYLILALNIFVLPLGFVLASRFFPMERPIAFAVLTLAIAPAAPLVPPIIARAGGNVDWATAYLVLFSALSVVFVPLALWVLPPLMPSLRGLPSPAWDTVLLHYAAPILLPLLAGLICVAFFPRRAAQLEKLSRTIMQITSMLIVSLVLYLYYPALGALTLHSLLIYTVFLGASLGLGWLPFAGSPFDARVFGSVLLSALRNFTVALIVVQLFSGEEEAIVLITAFGILTVLICFGLASFAGLYFEPHTKPEAGRSENQF